jgi:aldose 1-epimerase
MPEPQDTEIVLRHADLRLRVSPYGASLRGMWRETADGTAVDIVTGYSGANNKAGGQGDVLIPFPGRVAGGRYNFGGRSYQMPTNDKDGPNAIHGFLRTVVWNITGQTESEISFTTPLHADAAPGYPFSLRAAVTYALGDAGLTCRFTVTNTGNEPAPVAAGFHPYFTVGSEHIDGDTLRLPFASVLEFENLIPTGCVLPVDGTPLDFRAPRQIGAVALNHCFLHPTRDPDGLARVTLSAPEGDGRAVTVWMDRAFDYVVVYSGDPMPETHRRRALAIEPMTGASDAFNHPDWGLATLAPGATLTGTWGVTPG